MSINALGTQNYAQDIYSSALTKRAEKEKAPVNKTVKDIPETNNQNITGGLTALLFYPNCKF